MIQTDAALKLVMATADQAKRRRERMPNLLLLGRVEYQLMVREGREAGYLRGFKEPRRFLGLDIEVVEKESHMSVCYRWP